MSDQQLQTQRLQTLEDRTAISELMYRYGMSIDSRDWPALRSCFADEMEIDLAGTPYGGGKLIAMSGDQWLASIERIVSQFAVTQHMISPYHIKVDGDRAVCLAYLQARHFPADCKDEKVGVGPGRLLHQHDAPNSAGLEDPDLEADRDLAAERSRPRVRGARRRVIRGR